MDTPSSRIRPGPQFSLPPRQVHTEEDDRPAQELARPEALNSSLSYLERFPVDYVKIDGSFVGKLGEESGAAVLTRGVIDLAHALGLKVIAEGVETEGQLEELRELGCDLAQGHYFSEPLTGEAAGALLEARILR